MNTHFIQFSFGHTHLHHRAIFSILSLAAHYTFKKDEKILIFTDQETYFMPFLHELPVEYVTISQEDVNRMMGEDDLIHRVKIGVIQKTFDLYPHHRILYSDSDTFFMKAIDKLLHQISPENSLMHCFEFDMRHVPWDYPPHPITYEFSEMVKQTPVTLQGETIRIPEADFCSWNAGLLGLHPDHYPLLEQVYALTDQWYAKVRHHGTEQFAFSYTLEKNTTLKLADEYCYHYWLPVRKRITDELLSQELNSDLQKQPLSQKKEWAKKLSQKLPNLYKTHYYALQNNMAVAFQEKKYAKAYLQSVHNLFKKPKHALEILKDTGYYTKILFLKT